MEVLVLAPDLVEALELVLWESVDQVRVGVGVRVRVLELEEVQSVD